MDFREIFSLLLKLACVMCPSANTVFAGATIDDVYTLHSNLFANYNKNVRPVVDQDSAIDAGALMFMKSLQNFDEVNEKFSFVAAIRISWMDEKLKWNQSDYNGTSTITVSLSEVWAPELILSSPSDKVSTIGSSSDRVRIQSTGSVEWMPAGLIESTCSVNMRSYPFDKQSCSVGFASVGYIQTEVLLTPLASKIKSDVYSPNALWDLTDSDITTNSLGAGGFSEVVFTVHLKRKSVLVVMNLLMPILLLSVVNVFVFLLSPESGERIGFCITTLLAIAVYMTIVSDMLPQNPDPIPLISYKLFVDLLICVLIVLCTILNLSLYHRDENCPVPNWLQRLFRTLSCYSGRFTKVQPLKNELSDKEQPQSIDMSQSEDKTRLSDMHEIMSDGLPITWKRISYMCDWLALFTFIFMNIVNFAVYIINAKISSA